ncbi:hypothetical protein [Kribbella sp. VKM Ac-2568]|uniref:hypothetical protein n=1 Tax=Kribbella sp. VKM Ac-2568 TaxID=2512219 RepID=UPI0010497CEF|nr:hypothetical protein [Kribbella sp. VKM Ac-2568]TCM46081.1 hypothetical protein EV648_106548 [Kribbella sp. VKM Ac-2568]
MLRPLITVTAAVVLLAGCSGGDDKASNSSPDDGGQSASPTPTAPELASFDPPKAFAALSAIAEPRTEDSSVDTARAGMVGQTSLYANRTAITGRTLAGSSWQVLAKEVQTTKTTDFTGPMAVQLDGKEVIATAYIQDVQGSGTQKSHGQLNFQWIDPAEGKVITSIAFDLTPTLGPGNGGGRILSQAYDAATGQVVIALTVSSPDGTAKIEDLSVYADPKTKKATAIPSLKAAGVLNGVVIAAKGQQGEGKRSLSIASVDGATGTVKKAAAVPGKNYLSALGTGGRRAYLHGTGFVEGGLGHFVSSVYSVDIATGAIVETKRAETPSRSEGYTCFSDHATALVCNGNASQGKDEILAFDETTGKQSWGYTSESANRVVPDVTTVYNGAVYGLAGDQPVVMDAKTGQDVPIPTPTPSATPSDGTTPSEGGDSEVSPSDGNSPNDGPTLGGKNMGGWGDTSLIWGKPQSPQMVSKYGSTYLLDPGGKAPMGTEKIFVVQKAIG